MCKNFTLKHRRKLSYSGVITRSIWTLKFNRCYEHLGKCAYKKQITRKNLLAHYWWSCHLALPLLRVTDYQTISIHPSCFGTIEAGTPTTNSYCLLTSEEFEGSPGQSNLDNHTTRCTRKLSLWIRKMQDLSNTSITNTCTFASHTTGERFKISIVASCKIF